MSGHRQQKILQEPFYGTLQLLAFRIAQNAQKPRQQPEPEWRATLELELLPVGGAFEDGRSLVYREAKKIDGLHRLCANGGLVDKGVFELECDRVEDGAAVDVDQHVVVFEAVFGRPEQLRVVFDALDHAQQALVFAVFIEPGR